MTLLQDCMEVLKNNIYILSEDEQKNMEEVFLTQYLLLIGEELIGV